MKYRIKIIHFVCQKTSLNKTKIKLCLHIISLHQFKRFFFNIAFVIINEYIQVILKSIRLG